LNSRDRVRATVRREPADRTPLDFSANPATLARLKRDFGAGCHRDLLELLHVDIVDLRGVVDPVWCGPMPFETVTGDGDTINYWGMQTCVMETATGPEVCYSRYPLASATTLAEIEQYPWPDPDWFDFEDFDGRLDEWDGFAIMASGASIFQHPSFLRGLDNLLAEMIVSPEIAEYLMDRFTDFYCRYFERMFAAVPGKIDILRIADDIGMQDRPLVSMELFERCFVPRLKRLIDIAHSHGIAVMFHSCGAVVPFIDRLIEIGVDILDPVQVRAEGMAPEGIKERFGDRICFHGAVDTQYLLPYGTPDDIRRTVEELIETLGSNGGFIISPSHVLQTDVPIANITALYKTGYEYGCSHCIRLSG